MNRVSRALSLGAAGALIVLLSGCSMDALIWGGDGARVIDTTEHLIEAVATGEGTDLMCADGVADLGHPEDWEGLSAGEPERFHAEYWQEQVAADPSWNINLEGSIDGLTPGQNVPSDVFLRETEGGLCVTDVEWATIESIG
ncbi:hypothetical protein L1277_001506 [Okibacterium sp. HSC-33S16]|uniref:hypothetical protein n=1 Tax=Okibacterium sp. HSC-33S16 TaxID=2910965 RepID=UPI00209D7A16|nr:hypothetical protein [Okibacterium sp. HSC-33S16]MCP2031415.1 hypothetical protein [Okibacterium sp. HSC-33S16]